MSDKSIYPPDREPIDVDFALSNGASTIATGDRVTWDVHIIPTLVREEYADRIHLKAGRCRDCKHWKRPKDGQGVCDNDEFDRLGMDSVLTHDDFGCVQFEPKEKP